MRLIQGWRAMAVAVMATFVLANAVQAATLTVTPAEMPNTVGDLTTAPTGFGPDSLRQIPGPKAEFYVTPQILFGHSVTISQIQSVSWWTKKDAGTVDWFLAIYTAQQGDAGDKGSFYRSRLNAEPSFSGKTSTPGAWTQWSTDDATNPVKFSDQPRTGSFTASPTLAEIQAGPINWSSRIGSGPSSWDYRNETVSLFSLQTGSAWSPTFNGYVDGLTVTLTNGEVGTVDFAAAAVAVPVPASALVGLTGMALVVLTGLRRNKLAAA